MGKCCQIRKIPAQKGNARKYLHFPLYFLIGQLRKGKPLKKKEEEQEKVTPANTQEALPKAADVDGEVINIRSSWNTMNGKRSAIKAFSKAKEIP